MQQKCITSFFKIKAHKPLAMDPGPKENENITIKQKLHPRTLSTPQKKKKSSSDFHISHTINLESDENDLSDCSDKTINYSISPVTSSTSPIKTPATPTSLRSPRTPTSSEKKKFYSPSKNRNVKKRTPVKRKLLHDLNIRCQEKDKEFVKICDKVDDKTLFFLTLINDFLKENSLIKLLDDQSHKLLSRVMCLVKPGQKLVCRLYWRKDCFYRREQLTQIVNQKNNTSIDDPAMQLMINNLIENNFIIASTLQGNNSFSFDELAEILKVDELKQICKDLKLKVQSKVDAIEALRNYRRRKSISNFFQTNAVDNSKRVLDMMYAKVGICYKLSTIARNALYKLYLLMYLGMSYDIIREKKLELVLLHDLIKRETYPIDKNMAVDNASVVFESKREFDRFLRAHLVYEDFITRSDSHEKCEITKQVFDMYKLIGQKEMLSYISLPPWLNRYTSAYLYIKILESGVADLKKDKGANCLVALEILTMLIEQILFRQHRKAEWYAEKALILHSLGRYDEAAITLLDGFKSNMSEEAKDAMRPRAKKIANQKNISVDSELKKQLLEFAEKDSILESSLKADHIYKQPMEKSGRGKVKFGSRTKDGMTVQEAEDYCISHYIETGDFTHGGHWEGRIITTMFYLLFWDIIYSKPRGARGVFLCHFQLNPLDLFCESFYTNRKVLIDEWLRSIEMMSEVQLLTIMQEKWDSRPESEISPINRNIGWENVRDVVTCLGPPSVAAICRRLAHNYRYCHSGFPDLTLWNINTKQIRFVEVKTDCDKPSMKQIQWMRYLCQHEVDAQFCYVGVNTMRAKARAPKIVDALKFENDVTFEDDDAFVNDMPAF